MEPITNLKCKYLRGLLKRQQPLYEQHKYIQYALKNREDISNSHIESYVYSFQKKISRSCSLIEFESKLKDEEDLKTTLYINSIKSFSFKDLGYKLEEFLIEDLFKNENEDESDSHLISDIEEGRQDIIQKENKSNLNKKYEISPQNRPNIIDYDSIDKVEALPDKNNISLKKTKVMTSLGNHRRRRLGKAAAAV